MEVSLLSSTTSGHFFEALLFSNLCVLLRSLAPPLTYEWGKSEKKNQLEKNLKYKIQHEKKVAKKELPEIQESLLIRTLIY